MQNHDRLGHPQSHLHTVSSGWGCFLWCRSLLHHPSDRGYLHILKHACGKTCLTQLQVRTCNCLKTALATSSEEHSTKPKPMERGLPSGPFLMATLTLRMLPPALETALSKCLRRPASPAATAHVEMVMLDAGNGDGDDADECDNDSKSSSDDTNSNERTSLAFELKQAILVRCCKACVATTAVSKLLSDAGRELS